MISVDDAAVQTGASRMTLYRLIASGAVRPLKVPRDRRTFVSLAEVAAALAALPPARGRPSAWRQAHTREPPAPAAE